MMEISNNCAFSEPLFKDKVFYENYIKGAFSFLNNIKDEDDLSFKDENPPEHVLLCVEDGWFSIGKNLKEKLSEKFNMVSFCLSSDEALNNKIIEKLLLSVKNPKSILVIGMEELALKALKIIKNVPLCFFPLDFNFSIIATKIFKEKKLKSIIAIDENLLLKCSKNKISSAVQHVASKNILLVEMWINEAIAPHISFKEQKKLIIEGQKHLNIFFVKGNISALIKAILYCSLSSSLSNVSDGTLALSEIFKRQGDFCERGESEFLAYKILLRLYRLYLSFDSDFVVKKGAISEIDENLEQLFRNDLNDAVVPINKIYYTDEEIKPIKEKVKNSPYVIKLLEMLEKALPTYHKNIKKIYGGRKYTIENYSLKQRATAISLAPFLLKDFSFLKVIHSDGILEYL